MSSGYSSILVKAFAALSKSELARLCDHAAKGARILCGEDSGFWIKDRVSSIELLAVSKTKTPTYIDTAKCEERRSRLAEAAGGISLYKKELQTCSELSIRASIIEAFLQGSRSPN